LLYHTLLIEVSFDIALDYLLFLKTLHSIINLL
jgi:hypothetical protein